MWNSFYAGGPQREKRLEAFRKLLETQGKAVEILVLQEMCLGAFRDGWGLQIFIGYEYNVLYISYIYYNYYMYIQNIQNIQNIYIQNIYIYRIYIYTHVYINYII
jgi:hypothetical protein